MFGGTPETQSEGMHTKPNGCRGTLTQAGDDEGRELKVVALINDDDPEQTGMLLKVLEDAHATEARANDDHHQWHAINLN
jgi:hypothetical protein